jgi:MFS family permease
VFYVNLPVGIAAIAIVTTAYREETVHHKNAIDYLGAALLGTAIVALLLLTLWWGRGESIIGVHIIPTVLVLFGCVVWFIKHEGSVSNPILDLHFFRQRAFWVGNLLAFLASFAMYGIVAFMPLFARNILGGTSLEAGIVVTSMSLGWSGASLIAGRLVYKTGEKKLIRSGMVLLVLGFILTLFTSTTSSMAYLMLCMIAAGIGMGMQTPAMLLSVQHSVGVRHIGVATSTQMLARTIGGAIGVSVMGSVITASMLGQIGELVRNGSLSGLPEAAKAHLGHPQELLSNTIRGMLSQQDIGIVLEAFTNALHQAFLIGLVTALVAVVVSFLLPPATLHTLDGEN